MERRWFLRVCLAAALPACSKKAPVNRGSGVQATTTRPVGAFSALRVAAPIRVEVTIGPPAPLEITADDNLLQHVKSTIEGNTLVLAVDGKRKPKVPLRVRMSVSNLEGVRLGFGCTVVLRGLRAGTFNVEAGGGARLDATGSAATLTITARNAARVILTDFAAARASVKVSDGANVELGHLEQLSVNASGLSRVSYRGDPKLEQAVTKPARLIRAQ